MAEYIDPATNPIPQTNVNNAITGMNPQPGGPTPPLGQSLYRNVAQQQIQQVQPTGRQVQLRDQMAQDIAKASALSQQTQKRLGVITPSAPAAFREKGLIIGNQLANKKQLADTLKLQDEVVKKYVSESGFTDQTSQAMAASSLNDKLNKLRMELVKRGLEFDARLKVAGANDAARRQAATQFGSMAGTLAGGVIGAYFGGPAGAAGGASLGSNMGPLFNTGQNG